MKKIKLTISGLHCASCGSNVDRAVGKIKGVLSVSTSVMTNKSIIEIEDNVNIEEIKKTISNIGYKVTNVQ